MATPKRPQLNKMSPQIRTKVNVWKGKGSRNTTGFTYDPTGFLGPDDYFASTTGNPTRSRIKTPVEKVNANRAYQLNTGGAKTGRKTRKGGK